MCSVLEPVWRLSRWQSFQNVKCTSPKLGLIHHRGHECITDRRDVLMLEQLFGVLEVLIHTKSIHKVIRQRSGGREQQLLGQHGSTARAERVQRQIFCRLWRVTDDRSKRVSEPGRRHESSDLCEWEPTAQFSSTLGSRVFGCACSGTCVFRLTSLPACFKGCIRIRGVKNDTQGHIYYAENPVSATF